LVTEARWEGNDTCRRIEEANSSRVDVDFGLWPLGLVFELGTLYFVTCTPRRRLPEASSKTSSSKSKYNAQGQSSKTQAQSPLGRGMLLATQSDGVLSSFQKQTGGAMIEQELALALALRERAVSALEASTTMLQVANDLIKQGNQKEAARLRNEARYKRNESILLMDQATAVEHHRSNILSFPARETSGSDAGRHSSTPKKTRTH
jgi:hypothetical protein